MKKLFVSTILLAATLTANAGSIIWYDSKKEGEVGFKVLPTTFVSNVTYDEDDKKLVVEISRGAGLYDYTFVVSSEAEAKDIIKRFLDSNNNELIELKED